MNSLLGLAPSLTCIADAISTSPIKNNSVIINISVLSNPLLLFIYLSLFIKGDVVISHISQTYFEIYYIYLSYNLVYLKFSLIIIMQISI